MRMTSAKACDVQSYNKKTSEVMILSPNSQKKLMRFDKFHFTFASKFRALQECVHFVDLENNANEHWLVANIGVDVAESGLSKVKRIYHRQAELAAWAGRNALPLLIALRRMPVCCS